MSRSSEAGDRLVYTIVEVGELLGLTRNAAYDAAKRGDFPTIRIGKLIRVPKAALHAMIDGAGAK
jgi:excisionase family DNA binding protein